MKTSRVYAEENKHQLTLERMDAINPVVQVVGQLLWSVSETKLQYIASSYFFEVQQLQFWSTLSLFEQIHGVKTLVTKELWLQYLEQILYSAIVYFDCIVGSHSFPYQSQLLNTNDTVKHACICSNVTHKASYITSTKMFLYRYIGSCMEKQQFCQLFQLIICLVSQLTITST